MSEEQIQHSDIFMTNCWKRLSFMMLKLNSTKQILWRGNRSIIVEENNFYRVVRCPNAVDTIISVTMYLIAKNLFSEFLTCKILIQHERRTIGKIYFNLRTFYHCSNGCKARFGVKNEEHLDLLSLVSGYAVASSVPEGIKMSIVFQKKPKQA